jgi:cell division protein FtsB
MSLLQRQVISERKKKRLIFYTIFIIALFYIAMNLVGENGFFKYIELKNRKARLEKEIAELLDDNRRLRAQIEALKDDPFYIEKQAREEFGLAGPDEYIFEYENPSAPSWWRGNSSPPAFNSLPKR